ncbi:MAG: hypothetical protein ABI026_00710 [Gemmatimonadaceae bacterium]
MSGSSDSLGEWFDHALADVPGELAVRIRTALHPEWRDMYLGGGAEVVGEAAVAELGSLLQRGCDTRRAAPSLLTVDALVTYACELLAVNGDDIGAGATALLNALCNTLPNTEPAT